MGIEIYLNGRGHNLIRNIKVVLLVKIWGEEFVLKI